MKTSMKQLVAAGAIGAAAGCSTHADAVMLKPSSAA